MSASQQHGFVFENYIHHEVDRRLGDAARAPSCILQEPTARFDLPSWRDPTGQGIPTSIKVAKRPASGRVRVDLADARRTVSLSDEPFLRMLVGIYDQKEDCKVVNEVREYLIPGDCWSEAAGDVPPAMISRFHEALKDPDHHRARIIARQWKKKINQYYPGIIRWAPKIDSKNQRRLQCSVYLPDLEDLVASFPDASIRVYGRPKGKPHPFLVSESLWGDGLALPLSIPSPPRRRHAKKSEK